MVSHPPPVLAPRPLLPNGENYGSLQRHSRRKLDAEYEVSDIDGYLMQRSGWCGMESVKCEGDCDLHHTYCVPVIVQRLFEVDCRIVFPIPPIIMKFS